MRNRKTSVDKPVVLKELHLQNALVNSATETTVVQHRIDENEIDMNGSELLPRMNSTVEQEVINSNEIDINFNDPYPTMQSISTQTDLTGDLLDAMKDELNTAKLEKLSLREKVSTQTDLTGDLLDAMKDELNTAKLEQLSLREKVLSLKISEESFKNNNEKTTFYTGLPNFAVMAVLMEQIFPFLNLTSRSSLSKFQQLLLTLMKLRLNCSFKDLGYRFLVSDRTASRVFHNVIDILSAKLDRFVYWPERENLQKTMPNCFREAFGNKVAIIIDCFEVTIEKPSNLMARCQTWSSYKHRHTMKYLIGICPQGVISFISEGFGGRASDKFVTEESGILKKLLPGDVVLADRGFNIEESVGACYAQINIPAFTRGKDQLHPTDVEATRKIASVRIHVERVIGTVRQKYQILSSTQLIEMLSNSGNGSEIDKIVLVCCALTNMCPSVVSTE